MIECIICGRSYKRISWTHLHYCHGLTMKEYRAIGGLVGNEKICKFCSCIFVPTKQSRPFCDISCYRKYFREHCSGADNPFFGRHHSEETKNKLREANTGQVAWNKGLVGIASHSYGRKASEVTRDRIRQSKMGTANPFYGKHHSVETRQLISQKSRGHVSHIKGKSLEEFYGLERAKEIRQKLSLANKGEMNSNWQGGISKLPYSPEFTDELKLSIRQRDSFICQLCSIEESNSASDGRALIVHHIDYDKTNASPRNLIALCVRCNSRVNFRREHWQCYFREKTSCKGGSTKWQELQ